MRVDRAEQILQSDDRIPVELDGVSVWIDSVDSVSEKAKVHVENNPSQLKVVSVDELKEV